MRFLRDSATRHYDKAFKRLKTVAPSHVEQWANTSVWTVQAALEANDLEQARLGTIGLLAAIDVLLDK